MEVAGKEAAGKEAARRSKEDKEEVLRGWFKVVSMVEGMVEVGV